VTVPGEVVAALLIASPLTATYLLFFGYPQLQHSRFRHELWGIRDALVDDVIDGRLPFTREVKDLLLRLHLAIRYAPDHTMRSALSSMLLMRDQEIPNLRKSLTKARGLDAHQRDLLVAHYDGLARATVHHLVHGSPSGWLLNAAAQLVPVSLVSRKRRVRAVDTAEKELSALPRLYPEGKGLSARELAYCA
jgi:hypothetical protein